MQLIWEYPIQFGMWHSACGHWRGCAFLFDMAYFHKNSTHTTQWMMKTLPDSPIRTCEFSWRIMRDPCRLCVVSNFVYTPTWVICFMPAPTLDKSGWIPGWIPGPVVHHILELEIESDEASQSHSFLKIPEQLGKIMNPLLMLVFPPNAKYLPRSLCLVFRCIGPICFGCP